MLCKSRGDLKNSLSEACVSNTCFLKQSPNLCSCCPQAASSLSSPSKVPTLFCTSFLCSCSVGFRGGAVSLPCRCFPCLNKKPTNRSQTLSLPPFLNHTLEIVTVKKGENCCTFPFKFRRALGLHLLYYPTAKLPPT